MSVDVCRRSRHFRSLIAALSIGTLACGTSEKPAAAVDMRDSAGVTLTTILASPERLPRWELGDVSVRISGLAEAGGLYFEEVTDALWLSDGKIVVVDGAAGRLHMFDRAGAYLGSYGGEGRGPAELQRLGAVTVKRGDTIFAYDRALRSLKVFHPSSGFLRSIRLADPEDNSSPVAVWPWRTDRFVRYSLRLQQTSPEPAGGTVWRRPLTAVLGLLDESAGLLAEPVEFKGGYSGLSRLGDVRIPFSRIPVIFVGENEILYGSGQEFRLIGLDSTFRRRLEIRWPSLVEPIEASEIRRLRGAIFGSTPSRAEQRLADVMFSDELMPDARPALGRVLIDPGGRIWAARFEPPPSLRHETLWYVLDPRGRPIARLDIPRRRQAYLAAVRGDRVLLITRIALDVPSVEVVGLLKQ